MLQAFPVEFPGFLDWCVKMANMIRPFADARDALIMASTSVSNSAEQMSDTIKVVAFSLIALVVIGVIYLVAR